MSVNIDVRGEGVRPTLKTSRISVYLSDTGIIYNADICDVIGHMPLRYHLCIFVMMFDFQCHLSLSLSMHIAGIPHALGSGCVLALVPEGLRRASSPRSQNNVNNNHHHHHHNEQNNINNNIISASLLSLLCVLSLL